MTEQQNSGCNCGCLPKAPCGCGCLPVKKSRERETAPPAQDKQETPPKRDRD